MATNTKAVIAAIVTSTAITQPCTVRNLVHSACTRCQKLSGYGVSGERCGATPVVMTSPPPGTPQKLALIGEIQLDSPGPGLPALPCRLVGQEQ